MSEDPDPLFGYPNPNANFGPQFTPQDDPAPADSFVDQEVLPVPSLSSVAAAASAAAAAAAATVTMLPGDLDGAQSGGGGGGVGVVCP